jgi:hypothetical protein
MFPAAVGLILLFALAFTRAERHAEVWRRVAMSAGLSHVSQRMHLGVPSELIGEIDGFRVSFTKYDTENDHGTRLVVDGRGQVATSLKLRAEDLGASIEKTFGGKELEVGDPGFDAAVYAQGPEDVLLPLLDGEARSAVRALVGQRGRVTDGTVRIEVSGRGRPDALAAALSAALRVARSLRRPDDVVERLVGIARSDYFAATRLRCLDLLARRYPENELAREAFREALRSADADARLAAAIALPDEARDALVQLASDPEVSEPVAMRAAAVLGPRLPIENAASFLGSAMRSRRTSVALATIQALGQNGSLPAVSLLARTVAAGRPELAVAAVRALACVDPAAAQKPLIAALGSDEGEVRTAAAEALGRIGAVEAVAALHAAIEAHRGDRGLRGAAHQAIAAIQARLTGASPGQISLAEGETGQISLSDERVAGSVTLVGTRAPAPPPRLSDQPAELPCAADDTAVAHSQSPRRARATDG